MNLLALGVALFIRYGLPPEYKSNTTISLRYINGGRAINLIEDLNTLVIYQDYETLAQMLNVSQDVAKQIEGLSARSVDDIDLKNGIEMFSETIEEFTVSINATVYDYEILDELQQGLIYYFESNEFRKQEKALETKFLNSLIQRANYELNANDSIRKSIIKRMAHEGNNLIITDNSFQKEEEIFWLAEKRADYINQIYRVDNIQVVQPFVKFKNNTRIRLLLLLVLSFVIANLLALIIGFGRQYIKLND